MSDDFFNRPFVVRKITPPSGSQAFALVRLPREFYDGIGAPERVVIVLEGTSMIKIFPLPVSFSRNNKRGGEDARITE